MGIPSYFSYILKHHKHILKRNHITCHNLYLDANSMIYDNLAQDNIYEGVYNSIIAIQRMFSPQKTFICFDGVAPFAKMVQQKQRRYKSLLTNRILKTNSETNKITPGTLFMKELNLYLKDKMDEHTILSTTDEPGEGENKIFHYMRGESNDLNHVIYGLDADLIMLSLLQTNYKIYLYRETKYFAYLKYINETYDYILDVDLLGKQISEIVPVQEYCFLCFLCGNDFLPHFPSINIRNGGIEHILDHYKKTKVTLIQDGAIVWTELYKLFYALSKDEEAMIAKQIDWKTTRKGVTLTHADRLNYLPLYVRDEEEYLKQYPDQYNVVLFKQPNDDAMCKNYLEMLEWTWAYYNGKDVDLYMCYRMHYAPLFKSLLHHFPLYGESFLTTPNTTYVNPITQLLYVLPYDDFRFVPLQNLDCVLEAFPSLKVLHYDIQYSFCHFFWEAHVGLNYIPIQALDKFVLEHK